jgi:hypothetical protein
MANHIQTEAVGDSVDGHVVVGRPDAAAGEDKIKSIREVGDFFTNDFYDVGDGGIFRTSTPSWRSSVQRK